MGWGLGGSLGGWLLVFVTRGLVGLAWVGLGWFGLVWVGLGWFAWLGNVRRGKQR